MKVSKDAMTPDEFRELAERISKYVNLRGCRTEECINNRIKSKKSKKLNVLVEHGFGFRLFLESWINPHPVYKDILGMSSKEYNRFVEEKKESNEKLREINEYDRYLRSKRLKKRLK